MSWHDDSAAEGTVNKMYAYVSFTTEIRSGHSKVGSSPFPFLFSGGNINILVRRVGYAEWVFSQVYSVRLAGQCLHSTAIAPFQIISRFTLSALPKILKVW